MSKKPKRTYSSKSINNRDTKYMLRATVNIHIVYTYFGLVMVKNVADGTTMYQFISRHRVYTMIEEVERKPRGLLIVAHCFALDVFRGVV